MDRVLRFKHHLRAIPLDGERVFLIGERERHLLRGGAVSLVASLVDGRRSEREIVDSLQGRASPEQVYYALFTLDHGGFLVEVTDAPAPEAAGYWQALGADARRAAERLAATPVAVRAAPGLDPRPLVAALEGAGVVVASDGGFTAFLTDDDLDPSIDAWGLEALSRRIAWMPIKAAGTSLWWGPVLRPPGPCWSCLAHRLRANRPVEAYLERRLGAPISPPRVGLASGAGAAVSLAALSLARWIACGGSLDARLLALDVMTFRITEHDVARRPQCPACGDPEILRRRALQPITLERRTMRSSEDGGYRAASPEEIFARHERLISPITGVLGELGVIPGREHPLRSVYRASFPVRPADDAPSFNDFHRTSGGKGRSAAQARASALCEAIERYSAIFQGDEPRVRARLSELDGEAVRPAELQGFSEAQMSERGRAGAAKGDRRLVPPPPFDELATIDWTPVWSLTRERRRYVPTSYCYAHTPAPLEERFCVFDSNGSAAGSNLEEAILQGFLELVERDAVAVWWYNRVRRPGVDIDALAGPYGRDLHAHYRAMGWDLWVLDLTHDLEIPAFAAVARRPGDDRIGVGLGCHIDARLGISRALTELNQVLDPSPGAPAPLDVAGAGDMAYLFPDGAASPRARRDPSSVGDDLSAHVRECVALAARAGLETLVLDQTRPDIGLCVVKVIVPGLRHFWPRLGPGRLYDVPVRLGWRDRPLVEAELNPVPLLL